MGRAARGDHVTAVAADSWYRGPSLLALLETLPSAQDEAGPALALPVQYGLIAIDWYGMYSIFIPVYAFLLLPILAVHFSNFIVQ